MLFYSDPYKIPYGKLYGEIPNAWFTLKFEEAKVYSHEDTYVLTGIFTSLENVVRAYKPELSFEYPLKATWVIHSKDYEISKKNKDGVYEILNYKASIHEKLLYKHITNNPAQWLDHEQGIKGKISHLNNVSYEMQAGENVDYKLPVNSFEIVQVPLSGNLPDWTPPRSNFRNNSSNRSNSTSLPDKVSFLRKELLSTVNSSDAKEKLSSPETSLSSLLFEIVNQNRGNEMFLSMYIDLLKAVLS